MAIKSPVRQIQDAVHRTREHPTTGIVYALFSSLFMSLGHFLTQVTVLSTPRLSIFGVYFVHCAIQILLLIPFLLLLETRLFYPSSKWFHLFFMSSSRFLCDVAMFYAVSLVPVTITVAVFAACPFFALLFSIAALKENCYLFDTACAILNVIGVFLITRSPAIFIMYKDKEWIYDVRQSSGNYTTVFAVGCGIAVFSSMAGGLALVLQRKWAKSDCGKESGSYLINVLYSSVLGCLVTPMLMVLTGESFAYPEPTFAKWSFVAIGISTTVGLVTLALSLRTQYAPIVAIIRNFDVVFLFAFEYIDLYVPLAWWSTAGTVIITTSVIVLTCREKINVVCGIFNEPDDDKKDDVT